MAQAMANGKISGGGEFTKRCHDFFKQKYGFENCLLTNSCTAALEMAAILIDIRRTLDQGHRFVQKATRIGLISLGVVGGAGVVYVAIRFLR